MEFVSPADLLHGALVFSDYLPNPMRTTGVANIEKRYSSGGASPSHTPGSATPRGKVDQVIGNQEKSKGIGTPHYEEHIGDQKKQAGGGGGSNVWIHLFVQRLCLSKGCLSNLNTKEWSFKHRGSG